jgi:hypothetical protein
MARKFFLLVLLFVFSRDFVVAQDTPEMLYFTGGNLNLNFGMEMNSTGLSPNGGTFGGVFSPALENGVYSVFGNPAALGKCTKTGFMLDANWGLSFSGKDLVTDKDIASGTDDFLKDTTTYVFKEGNFKSYTKINSLDLAFRRAGFRSFAVTLPVSDYFTFGFGYSRPLSLSLDFALSGLNTALRTSKTIGNNVTAIDFILNSDLKGIFDFKMSTLSFSVGAKLAGGKHDDHLFVGASLIKYSLFHRLYFNFYSDGVMILNNTNEYYFNDPGDPNLDRVKGETNKLFWNAEGNYSSSRWGAKFGLVFEPKISVPFMNFSLDVNIVPNFYLTDPNAFSESYQPKFLVGRLMGNKDEALDIIIDPLNLAKPNLTVPTHNVFTDSVIFSLPSSLNFGFDFKLGKHTLALNLVKYFGELSYKMDKYKIGKKASGGVKFGVDFRFPDKMEGWDWVLLPVRLFYLDFDGLLFQLLGEETAYSNPHFRIGGGLMFGDAIVEGISDKDQEKALRDLLGMPLPSGFAFGKSYTIFHRITVSTVVYGFPDLFMKYSFSYAF